MAETRSFQAEVSRLLEIVAHSLYSDKKVFLRELISNASDACDRLRYLALTQPELGAPEGKYRVVLTADEAARTLTIEDNGIGMSEAELIDNLGTIARSGTAAFVKQLGEAKSDTTLIGQFGVGFYSAFMVADRVEVISRKADETAAHRWESDGKGEFTVAPAEEKANVASPLWEYPPSSRMSTSPSSKKVTGASQRRNELTGGPVSSTGSSRSVTVVMRSTPWTAPG